MFPESAIAGSWNQQDLSRRLSSFEIAMRLLRIRQRVLVANAQLQLSRHDVAEDAGSAMLELGARRDVVRQRRPREKQRAFAREQNRIEGRHRAARSAEEHEIAARTKNLQILVEGRPADAVIDNVHAFAAGQTLRLRLEVMRRVVDDLIRSRFPRERDLLLG